MSTFSNRLKTLREEKNKTLDEMAEDLGTTKATLSRYENDKRRPKMDFIEDIANYFDVSIDYLLGRINNKSHLDSLNIPKRTLELLSADDLEFITELAQDDQRQLLMRESRRLSDEDLAKIITVIKTFAKEEDVPPEK